MALLLDSYCEIFELVVEKTVQAQKRRRTLQADQYLQRSTLFTYAAQQELVSQLLGEGTLEDLDKQGWGQFGMMMEKYSSGDGVGCDVLC